MTGHHITPFPSSVRLLSLFMWHLKETYVKLNSQWVVVAVVYLWLIILIVSNFVVNAILTTLFNQTICKKFRYALFFLFISLFWRIPWYKGSWGQHGPIWGRQDSGRPPVGPMNFAIWVHVNHFRALIMVDSLDWGNLIIVTIVCLFQYRKVSLKDMGKIGQYQTR